MTIRVRGLRFATRRAVATYCGVILQHGELTPDDEAFIREVLKWHPRVKTIVGPGVGHIVVDRNGFGDACFVVERIDGKRVPFSFVTCITAKFEAGSKPELR